MKIRNLWTIATIAFVASSCNATSEDDALVNVFPETTVVQALHNGEALEFIVTADEDATVYRYRRIARFRASECVF